MSKLTLAKNLHLCFSMLIHPKPPLTTTTTTTDTQPHSPPPSTTTTSFIKTYNSLYEATLPPSTTTTITSSSDTDMGEAEAEPPTTPDLTAAYASRRFFISSPGRSNSIVDSLSLSSLEEEPPTEVEEVVAGGVAVQTYSPDPYSDFLRSMADMVAARGLRSVEEAWEYLQELLLSYLALNPKSTHKYIVGAFADLVFSILSAHDNHNHNHNHDQDHDHNNADDVVVGSTSLSASSSSSSSPSSSCGVNGGEIMDE